MPIKPENKHRYPANWQEIRERILNRAKRRCEFCGVPHCALGWRNDKGEFRPISGDVWMDAAGRGERPCDEAFRGMQMLNSTGSWGYIVIVLTIAHLDQQPENNEEENLRALCQRCHVRLDPQWHIEAHE